MTTIARYHKPLPVPDPDSAGYWRAAREHRLAILRCDACGFYVHYPRGMCPECWGESLSWTEVSGRGTVYSFVVVHHQVVPGFEEDGLYVPVLVAIEEQPGVRVLASMVECEPADVRIGMPVEVAFDDVTPEITLPRFRPAAGSTERSRP